MFLASGMIANIEHERVLLHSIPEQSESVANSKQLRMGGFEATIAGTARGLFRVADLKLMSEELFGKPFDRSVVVDAAGVYGFWSAFPFILRTGKFGCLLKNNDKHQINIDT